jgi:hypothetical protein
MDAAESVQRLAEHLRNRDWTELGRQLDVALVRDPLPAEAAPAWGLDPEDIAPLEHVEIFAAGTGYRILLARGDCPYRIVRRNVLATGRHNPDICVVWWWVRDGRISVGFADERPGGRRFVRWLETELDDPDPVGLRRWESMRLGRMAAADVIDSAEAFRRHMREVASQDRLTREFFEGFSDGLDRLTEAMTAGPDDEQERHDIALATLLRIVFLYFVQRRGALDGDRRFVVRHLREARGRGESFYRTVLRPLFFGALNRSVERRPPEAKALGDIPFLNGGLFEPLALEETHPEVDVPNEVWGPIIEGLLERFYFATTPAEGADETHAVDPEMLGKVFEGLMYGGLRHASGSFYTPRDLVRGIVVDALSGYLNDKTGVPQEVCRALAAEGQSPADPEVRDSLAEALEGITVLDPAVGTGAFLLEALRRLEACYHGLGVEEVSGSPDRRRARLIHRHLFGVDLQRTAVRICELRLWLAIFEVAPDGPVDSMAPLPNLGHRIACGNSLISPADTVTLRAEGTSSQTGAFAGTLDVQGLAERGDKLAALQSSYLETHGEEKLRVRRRMEAVERSMHEAVLEGRRSRLEERAEPLRRMLNSEDLFGETAHHDDETAKKLADLEAQIEAIDTVLEDLEAGRASALGFSYESRFGGALEDDGFDVIVTNPPWVRSHRMDPSQKGLLKARYQSFDSSLWPEASNWGIRQPFGTQVDMAALFVERATELLAEGGRLGALVPVKLFGSLSGASFRGMLTGHEIVALEDLSESDRDHFDATVYPAVLHLRRGERPPGGPRARRRTESRPQNPRPRGSGHRFKLSVWSGDRRMEWQTRPERLPAVGRDMREPWLLVPPDIQRVLASMREGSAPLGSYDGLGPKRGVMTGRNRVFVRQSDEVEAWIEEGVPAGWFRPVFGGRNVRQGRVEPEGHLIWGYDEMGQVRTSAPAPLEAFFEEHRAELEARADHRPGMKPWEIFRLNRGLHGPKVVWRDMGPMLEAAVADPEFIPLNTVYFIGTKGTERAEVLAAVLNSAPMRGVARAVAERARGGWRRHLAWVMRMLPLPASLAHWLTREGPTVDRPVTRLVKVVTAEAGPAEPGVVDACVADCFGLDSSQLSVLRDWLPAQPSRREAA